MGGSAGAGVAAAPGPLAGGSAGFPSGSGRPLGTSACAGSTAGGPAGGANGLAVDLTGGRSGIAGMRSGSGPSRGSAFRLGAVLGDPDDDASVAGIEDAGELTAAPAGSTAVDFTSPGDGLAEMLAGSFINGPVETVRGSATGAGAAMPAAAGAGIG